MLILGKRGDAKRVQRHETNQRLKSLFVPLFSPRLSSSSFSKRRLLSAWAEDGVAAQKTNARLSNRRGGVGRRGQRVVLPHHAGATGVTLVFAAQQPRRKKLSILGRKQAFAVHSALCRGGSGADKMFLAACAPSAISVVTVFGRGCILV